MSIVNFIHSIFFKKNTSIISIHSENRLSRTLARSFAKPIKGVITSKWDQKYDDVVQALFFFGNPELWFLFEIIKKHSLDFYYTDKAYFDRSNYFRITRNALQLNDFSNFNSKRFEKFKIPILPRRYGSKILICPQSETFFKLNGLSREDWLENTIQEIRKYSDRPIEIRYKERANTEAAFSEALKDIHCVVVYTSVAGVQSVLSGVPSFSTHDSAASHFSSGPLANIEAPFIPDNIYELACALANNQWTIDEIKQGLPHKSLGIKML
jgi:hypothetical protein